MSKLRRWVLPILTLAISLFGTICSALYLPTDGTLQANSFGYETIPQLSAGLDVAQAPIEKEGVVKKEETKVSAELAKRISSKWGVDYSLATKVVDSASQHSYQDFPRMEHILAVIAVESSFKPNAFKSGNTGLMQVNVRANGKHLRNKTPEENIRVGSSILRQYYGLVGKKQDAAVSAYNSGVGAYLKGKYKKTYLKRYKQELARIESYSAQTKVGELP